MPVSWTPPYTELHRSGELARRIEGARESLRQCRVCPWNCEISRLEDERKVCKTGRYARVASAFAHFGEEDCLRGTRGSGTIFFAWCNLRCVFCQNYDISQEEAGKEVNARQLAGLMLRLQEAGCHNINWVTPEHVVPQILESLPYAIEGGLRLPIVYNTSGFDSIESIRSMEGIVSVYMPDFKYWNPEKARRYLKRKDYPDVARAAIREMHAQTGDLVVDDEGIARKGLLIRHLVMPDAPDDTREIMRFLAEEISPDTYVNLMDQYHPQAKVSAEKYTELNRGVTSTEMKHARTQAEEAGLHRFDERRSRQFI